MALGGNPYPQLPEAVKKQALKTTVRAVFLVAADGSVEVQLTESSGNSEADAAILEQLRRWRFKPGVQAGVPCASSVSVRFNFSVD